MAVITCSESSSLILQNGENSPVRLYELAGSPGHIRLGSLEFIQLPCSSDVSYDRFVIEGTETVATVYVTVVPYTGVPYAEILMGFAGLLSGFLVAYAISRVGR